MTCNPPSMPVFLLAWKSVPKNSLRGFAKIRIGKSLIVNDVAVHCNSDRRWAALPSKPLIEKNGTAKKDENGKIAYVPILEWADRDTSNRFSAAVIEAVEREYPGQTQGDYAP